MASYCAFFDFVLFVPLEENYNLGYSLIRRIPEVVVDVTAFAIGAGSGSGVRNASGRPTRGIRCCDGIRYWNGYGGDSLLERIRYWHRTALLVNRSEVE